ncbi:uncharacterized protein K452DRAFT_62745 [Aplosporella prunicola CBS 121167]|uniref:Uncharacterized protein n=1 Tax=Aplosporella prunicola CBS 121167 TaxID=1176127 RepID=A0A6A6B646_9PEZI|nr:uncharacterized protein K452DRAFT_62745 [Aplosporella prunicola CBS 121167]KAF2139602.1 hypothetical protein K452DRAFT_62745 [Aplosporella prunicola CBS 121167]
MSWGRGGAGNIGMGEEASRRAAEDTEAANPVVVSPTATSPTTTSTPQEYAHMGRGGAGNYYSPATLAQTGATTDTTAHSTPTAEPPLKDLSSSTSPNISSSGTTTTTPPTSASASRPETPLARTGRGGAGNFVWGGGSERSAERVRAQHEERKRREEEVRASVQADVERGLPRPGRAFLGEGSGNAAADPATAGLGMDAGMGTGLGRERLR